MSAHVHPRDRGATEWEECCVAHMDNVPGGCVHCVVCGQWVRPHDFGAECPGPREPQQKDETFWYGKERGVPRPDVRTDAVSDADAVVATFTRQMTADELAKVGLVRIGPGMYWCLSVLPEDYMPGGKYGGAQVGEVLPMGDTCPAKEAVKP